MNIRAVQDPQFRVGDLVIVKSLGSNKHFCIIGFKHNHWGERLAVLKGLFRETLIIEQPVSELQSLLIRGQL